MISKAITAFFMFTLLVGCSTGGSKDKNLPLWSVVEESSVNLEPSLEQLPEKYLLLKLNIDSLENNLNLGNKEGAYNGNLSISIPLPNGEFKSYSFEKSSIMSEKLAKKFPNLHTFKGKQTDDASRLIRFEWTNKEFTAMFEADEGQVFIQPYSKGNNEYYLCFYKQNLDVEKEPFEKSSN